MTTALLNEILQLSISERLILIGEIWDTITPESDAVGLTEAQKQELDSRLRSYRQNPVNGSTWDEVKQRIQNL
ncbi:addiction module protein [Argonema antarcticum]|uniref:addiction module protein n=1 Tax=Argonema antarcticum TaxID=2942763 RepID=UPI002013AC56|nr:addiction module protein [Argonema antarcticum]MCL1471804.1 addiction module protein [Argonema antarcticum A004/B2]